MKTNLFKKSCRAILFGIALLALGGLASLIETNSVNALENKTYDTDWTPNSYSSMTSLNSDTFTITGAGQIMWTDYLVYISTPNSQAQPAAKYQIAFSTYVTQSGAAYLSTTTNINIPPNVLYPVKLWIGAYNPQLFLNSLAAGATFYLQINYGQQRYNH